MIDYMNYCAKEELWKTKEEEQEQMEYDFNFEELLATYSIDKEVAKQGADYNEFNFVSNGFDSRD